MNIAFLCKMDEVTAGIATYLEGRDHRVSRTDERVSSVDLAHYDIGISFNYRHILIQRQIDAVKLGILNFHSGWLPDFRGANPNIWQLIHGYGGCTCHFIDAGIDTGPIVARKRADPEWVDTGQTYYRKLGVALERLFYETWPVIEACGDKGLRVPSLEQPEHVGFVPDLYGMPTLRSEYRMKDVANIDDVTQHSRLVRTLAARTFPPYRGCYINTDKGKVYIEVKMSYDN